VHFEEHLLIGWHLSQFSGLERRERIAIALAAVIPDVDALPRLAGQEWYEWAHHTFGHSLLFGGALVAAAWWWAGDRPGRRRFALFCGLAFLSHLLADLFGTMWQIYVFWPFSSYGLTTPYSWWLGDWRNRAILLGLLAAAVPSMLVFRHSPLELLNADLDRLVTAFVVRDLRPGGACECGREALGRCTTCNALLCGRCTQLGTGFAPTCRRCREGA